jgi:hypothetical protein
VHTVHEYWLINCSSKRRRNTEASARFRAKKKEKESALETHAKELEASIAQLTAENSSLRNENTLLKAIVLGGHSESGSAESLRTTLAAISSAKASTATTSAGPKRKREQ